MTYQYKHITKEQKIEAIVMRQKINEADLYDFELNLSALNMAVVKDQALIDEFTNRVNDKIAQNTMFDSMILDLNSN